MDMIFGIKMSQISPEFSDQILVHFGSPSQSELKPDLKKPPILDKSGQHAHIGPKSDTPDRKTSCKTVSLDKLDTLSNKSGLNQIR